MPEQPQQPLQPQQGAADPPAQHYDPGINRPRHPSLPHQSSQTAQSQTAPALDATGFYGSRQPTAYYDTSAHLASQAGSRHADGGPSSRPPSNGATPPPAGRAGSSRTLTQQKPRQPWAEGEGSEHEADSDYEQEQDDGTRFSDEDEAGAHSEGSDDSHPGSWR